MSTFFNVHVPGINDEVLPVTVAAPSETQIRQFLTAVLNGMQLDKPCSIDTCSIEALRIPGGADPVADIHLDDRGLALGSLMDLGTLDTARLMSLYSAVSNAMDSLKQITLAIGQLDDGSYLINLDNAFDVMSFAHGSLDAALFPLESSNLNHKIALLQRHPSLEELRELIFVSNQDKDGSIFFCEEAADVIERAEQVANMDSKTLLRVSINNLLREDGLIDLIDKPYNAAWADVSILDDRKLISFSRGVILDNALRMASKTMETDDLLTSSVASNRDMTP